MAGGDFEDAVIRAIQALRSGEVVTYGELAAEVGHPGAARAVGTVLARSGDTLPWWRVVAANGRLVPGHERRHSELLRNEGVVVDNGKVRGVAGAARRSPMRARPPDDCRAGLGPPA